MDGLQRYLDVTFLNEHIHHKDIKLFCQKINKMDIKPASVCVYPQHVEAVQGCLSCQKIPITTVLNFPHGLYEWPQLESDILHAISLNVSELDIVIPYGKWLSQHSEADMIQFAEHCQEAVGDNITLKYIIETGVLQAPELIADISLLLCQHGANFIKTSTGKTVPGATILAATAIISAIKQHEQQTGQKVGLKIAGGIRTREQAYEYIDLVRSNLGEKWLDPQYFRIGCSQVELL